jgi:hypothetical protein
MRSGRGLAGADRPRIAAVVAGLAVWAAAIDGVPDRKLEWGRREARDF